MTYWKSSKFFLTIHFTDYQFQNCTLASLSLQDVFELLTDISNSDLGRSL